MFGDVKLFGRVASGSIAAFVVISTGLLCGYTGAIADANTLAVIYPTPTAREAPVRVGNSVRGDNTTWAKVAALYPAMPRIKASPLTEPFGLKAMPWFAGDIFMKWKGVEADIRTEMDILARCLGNVKDCSSAAQKFLAIVAVGRAQTGRARIGEINRAINLAIQPMSDLKQWGIDERWSAPLETLTTGRGDCEDYAIAKFVALMAAGVASEDVKLVIVQDLAVSDGHAIIAVYVDGSWIVLDNRWLALVEDYKMHRMSPLFVIDHTGVKAYVRLPPENFASALLD